MRKYEQQPSEIRKTTDGWLVIRPNGRKVPCWSLVEAERIAGRLVLTPADVARAMDPPWITDFYQRPF